MQPHFFHAGSLVLLEGIDSTITKTATIVPEFLDETVYIFQPLQFQTQAVMKIACEPLNPSELPKMVRPQKTASKAACNGIAILLSTCHLSQKSGISFIKTLNCSAESNVHNNRPLYPLLSFLHFCRLRLDFWRNPLVAG